MIAVPISPAKRRLPRESVATPPWIANRKVLPLDNRPPDKCPRVYPSGFPNTLDLRGGVG